MIATAWVLGGIFVLLALGLLALRRLGSRMGALRADEVHMVVTSDVWRVRLCRYKARNGEGQGEPEPILFCHGFMSNQFNFALPPGEGMVDYFAERGYDCWAIDLRGNLSSVAPFGHGYNEPTMDDYLLRDIPAALDYIRKTTGCPQAHWIGHSMGGMLLYAFDATFGNGRIASATTMGSPIGFDGMDFHSPWLPLLLRRVMGRLAFRGGMLVLLSAFVRIKPDSKLVPVNWLNLNPQFDADAFFTAADAPPIRVAEALSNAAQTKSWKVKNGEVDVFESLPRMKTPLFAIFGAADPLVPAETVDAFFDKVAAPDKRMLLLAKDNGFAADYSHLDLVFGKETPTEVYLPILEWIKAHPVAGAEMGTDTDKRGRTRTTKKAPAAKKPPAKKPPEKKPPARKPGAKKDGAKKPVAKKAPAKRTAAAKKPATRKPAVRKPRTR